MIHCRRSPRDNALSIWMENFNPEQRYATDFDDLAFFHAEYSRLMAHWREVLPLRMLDVRYEDTVADPERPGAPPDRFPRRALGCALPRLPSQRARRADTEPLAGAPTDLRHVGRTLAKLRAVPWG